ncbi:MAG TPA: cation-translocating P-type ATPase [Rhodocyclaceae bacterium]|jgi:Ca2+-transporting ATPase
MNPSTPPTGLSRDEAAARLRRDGYNELAADQGKSFLKIVLTVMAEPMFLLLLGAGLIYLLMGDVHEALILLGFVVVIMTLTSLQERRTEKTLAALRDLSSPRALVLRDGKVERIPGREVVRGDLLLLSEGDRVPADGVVLEAHELALDESLLTGESVTVTKTVATTTEGDDASRVSAGTLIVSGQGRIQVMSTGLATTLGSISQSLQDIDDTASPLHREMASLAQRLAIIGIGLCLILTLVFVWLRGTWLDGLLAGITLAMSILPQEFPVILIVFLALGARRIASHKVLTRHLAAIETLGETTVLCVDKTGTLTQNRMAVAALYVNGQSLAIEDQMAPLPEHFHELVEFGVLASEMAPHDPMEQAFHRLAGEYLAQTEHLHPDWALVHEYELSQGLLAMSHLWQPPHRNQQVVAAKGAPEAIADLCHLDPAQQETLNREAERMADQGLRVLGFAKAVHSGKELPDIQHDFAFEFLGLVGLADPIRPEVPAAIAECHAAGIRVVMITGDHPRTAQAIAAQAGLRQQKVITGAELAALSEQDLLAQCHDIGIFARVNPGQKLAIVQALKTRKEIVAMTGDGVNDAPALKAAHIGIAMGRRGTDVAREAASLVLLEDDFSAIVAAVRQGRRIFANLRQAMVYTLGVHIPIVGLSILPLLLGLPPLLAPVHIAFLELVIDPTCSIVFEAEPAPADLMKNPPRPRGDALLTTANIWLSLALGGLATAASLITYHYGLDSDIAPPQAKALAFITLITASTALIFSSRKAAAGLVDGLKGIPKEGLIVVTAVSAALLLITRVDSIARIFTFAPPAWPAAWAAFALGLLCYPLFEGIKAVFNARKS